jgi:hypothetical protein
MKKPDRKEFRREYGPRAPQKFARAMQKYRKAQAKKKKLGPPTPSTSRIGRLTDPMVQRRQAAEKRSLTSKPTPVETTKTPVKSKKPEQAKATPTAKTEEKKSTTKPVTKSSKPNTGTGRDGKFGRGTYGSGRPSDGKPKTKPKQGRGGSRARVNPDRKTTSVADVIKNLDNMLKLTHKKGDIKKVGGSTYRWNGRRWEKLNRPF